MIKTLKRLAIALTGIIAIVLLAALFVNKNYAVEREVVVDKPKAEVFEYVKMLRNQEEFSVWGSMDPEMKKEYRGIDGQVGFVSAWESKNDEVGAGEQEIINIVDGERIDFELRFIKPFQSTSVAYMITESVEEEQTKVKWGFSGQFDYPMNLMLVFMDMEGLIGEDFEVGLNSLKSYLESR
jgi:hypothetical protein